jgi:5-methylcytosine-specific restriction enzyme subunit McrC
LEACGHLKASSAGGANVKKQNLNLLEVYFDLYLQELNRLLHLGLVKQYRKETSNVKALKGKLEFAGNIRKNIVHKERFFTTHQVYDQNHLLHQILKTALTIVSQFCKESYLIDSCRRIELHFPEVDAKRITKAHLDNLKLNRKTASYSYALELARLIILNYSPDISTGKERMLSLLFDMNVLWEEYVLKKLKETLADSQYEVTGQESLPFIHYNTLRPDIVIRDTETNETYIIDTKWKIPKDTADVSDLRQMYTYARFWDAKKVLLLYPGKANNEAYRNFQTDEYYAKEGSFQHACKLGFVSVLDEENELDEGIGSEVVKLLIY